MKRMMAVVKGMPTALRDPMLSMMEKMIPLLMPRLLPSMLPAVVDQLYSSSFPSALAIHSISHSQSGPRRRRNPWLDSLEYSGSRGRTTRSCIVGGLGERTLMRIDSVLLPPYPSLAHTVARYVPGAVGAVQAACDVLDSSRPALHDHW